MGESSCGNNRHAHLWRNVWFNNGSKEDKYNFEQLMPQTMLLAHDHEWCWSVCSKHHTWIESTNDKDQWIEPRSILKMINVSQKPLPTRHIRVFQRFHWVDIGVWRESRYCGYLSCLVKQTRTTIKRHHLFPFTHPKRNPPHRAYGAHLFLFPLFLRGRFHTQLSQFFPNGLFLLFF